MNVTITSHNESFAHLVCDYGILREMSDRFCFKPEGYQFTPAYKAGIWNGEIRLVHAQSGQFPKGLVPEVIDALESSEYKVRLELEGFKRFAEVLPLVDIESLKLDFVPHDYQIKAVERVLTKKRQIILSPTGSGKSLILYLLVRSLEDQNILITVPNISLVTQLFSDFEDYSKNNSWNVEDNVHTISEGNVKVCDEKISIEMEDGNEYTFDGNEYIKLINSNVKQKLAKDITEDDEIDDLWLSKQKRK